MAYGTRSKQSYMRSSSGARNSEISSPPRLSNTPPRVLKRSLSGPTPRPLSVDGKNCLSQKLSLKICQRKHADFSVGRIRWHTPSIGRWSLATSLASTTISATSLATSASTLASATITSLPSDVRPSRVLVPCIHSMTWASSHLSRKLPSKNSLTFI